ncbi:MAG: hypothetical protein Faunusvirus17_7 [Faunusvirus sp.]|jgi:hypothetical protein|uniref:Uncharacterized protein n=1 Tax=Faunusvirus sp. TaxID=2487766 RepID=A0A3G4ZX43_9VIRU|nr:MAG: hypothetical protein Faunusvirus17_7 [Faunusvirus sp.]
MLNLLNKLSDIGKSEPKEVKLSQKDTRKRIAPSMLSGEQLTSDEIKQIDKIVKLLKFEKIELLYLYGDKFNALNMSTDIVVGVTNYRIFKIENAEIVSSANRKDIVTARHQKNGMFKWDKVVVFLSVIKKTQDQSYVANLLNTSDPATNGNPTFETFGIYDSSACEFVCNYIETHPYVDPLRKIVEDEYLMKTEEEYRAKRMAELRKEIDDTTRKQIEADIGKLVEREITGVTN